MGVNDNQTKPKAAANGILAYGQRQVDRVVSPPTRQKAYDATANFAQERPLTFVRVFILPSLGTSASSSFLRSVEQSTVR